MKKTYEKPVIKKVELRPEEAALTACKTGATGCNTSAGDSSCKAAAS